MQTSKSHHKLFMLLFVFLSSCSFTINFKQMAISPIPLKTLKKELTTKSLDIKQIRKIVENSKWTTKQKIKILANKCTIKDLTSLFWYLNFVGKRFCDQALTLHTANEVFAAKIHKDQHASFECVEGAMLAAYILRQKQIEPFILLIHDFKFAGGHAVCVYRTSDGWATIGINESDFITPTPSLTKFKDKLNHHFAHYTGERYYNKNIVLYYIRSPEDLHSNFIEGRSKYLLWSNIMTFFGSGWY